MTQEELDRLTQQAIADHFAKHGNPIMEKTEQDVLEILKKQSTPDQTPGSPDAD